jgi:holo-[acyl-carrier protein] synthase
MSIANMKVLCGIDLIHIPDFIRLLDQPQTLKKLFHNSELKNRQPQHLAGIVAAKEAFFKAVGTIPHFLEIELTYTETGKPQLVLSPELNSYSNNDVSISHDGDYAQAIVIITK